MILQGVKLTIQPLEVGYANRPNKGVLAFPPIYGPAWLWSNNLCEVVLDGAVPTTKCWCYHKPCFGLGVEGKTTWKNCKDRQFQVSGHFKKLFAKNNHPHIALS